MYKSGHLTSFHPYYIRKEGCPYFLLWISNGKSKERYIRVLIESGENLSKGSLFKLIPDLPGL